MQSRRTQSRKTLGSKPHTVAHLRTQVSQVYSWSRGAPLQSKRFHSVRAFCNTMFAACTCSFIDKGVPAKLALGTDIPLRALATLPVWFLYMICQKPTDWLEACVRQAIFPCSDSVSNSPNVASPSPR